MDVRYRDVGSYLSFLYDVFVYTYIVVLEPELDLSISYPTCPSISMGQSASTPAAPLRRETSSGHRATKGKPPPPTNLVEGVMGRRIFAAETAATGTMCPRFPTSVWLWFSSPCAPATGNGAPSCAGDGSLWRARAGSGSPWTRRQS
ncbi:hypothetical protein Scep_001010 [Stephania cephalantha]|uniref:Uncharacterized protein n=1 Tax=Stephania cephalantha TaxID=152367 RepID=A0AAP0Q4N0_9MAGN